MGGSLHPPASELNKDFYCRKADKSDRWRNLFENPATAQFDHRMLVRPLRSPSPPDTRGLTHAHGNRPTRLSSRS